MIGILATKGCRLLFKMDSASVKIWGHGEDRPVIPNSGEIRRRSFIQSTAISNHQTSMVRWWTVAEKCGANIVPP
jgi:hypothetical protein